MPEYLRPGVYVQVEPSGVKPIEGVGTSTACFIGAAPRGRPNYPTFVSNWSDYERMFGGLDKNSHLGLSVFLFFLNGGRRMYIVRLLGANAVVASASVSAGDGEITLEAAGAGLWGNSLFVKIVPRQSSTEEEAPFLDLVVESLLGEGRQEVERLPNLGVKEDGERFYASIINRDSNYVKVRAPESGDFPEGAFAEGEVQLQGGTDGDVANLFAPGNIQAALESLKVIDDINILAIPGAVDNETTKAGIDHAAAYDMQFLVDCAGDSRNRKNRDVQVSDVRTQVAELGKDSHAALYFPWIEVADPFSRVAGATRFVPPSGPIAGLYARIDNRRGVWKAPAGTEATIAGAVGLAVEVSDGEQEILNPLGVNCIRQFADSGIVCWGARTLATRQDPEYRYVPVRRFTTFLAKSLYRGTQWVVFEPNDEPLWAAIRFNLNAFMLRQFAAGALQGSKPEDAFFVKCDAENNPQASIDAGEVHIMVAFAPLKPAEFVIIHLTQLRKE